MPSLPRRFWLLLTLLGLLIVCCSLAALLYAFWPVQGVVVQATVAPTLLTPP